MAPLTLAVPDLISNSYFPAVAAVELGYFAREGHDVALDLIFPVDKCYSALRDGQIALVGGSAHSALSSFPGWKGVKLLAAQAQGMYWFLVVRKDLFAGRGNLDVIKGKRIGAAPWVEMGLRQLLVAAGYDLQRDNISIAPVPGTAGTGTNFGLTAAKALEAGLIDGFWANGMGCEVAVRGGAGAIVLDVRRGDGPAGCFDYTLASIATTDSMIEQNPNFAAAAVRALSAAKATLRQNPEIAGDIARKIFPPAQAELIVDIIRRDLPYYSSHISADTVAGMNAFARKIGILKSDVPYEAVVATQFAPLWTT